MASKRTVSGVRKRVKTPAKKPIKKQEKPPVAEVKSEYPSGVSLRLRLGGNARYVTIGSVTGKRYEFRGNSVLSVEIEDAPDLLAKTVKNACCGASSIQSVFEKV